MNESEKPSARALSESAVMIVGGTSGVGLASAIRFAVAGAAGIALVGRNAERGEKARKAVLSATPGANVEFISADANEEQQAVAACDAVISRFGRIDVQINSTASPSVPKLFHNNSLEDLRAVVTGQLMPPILMNWAALASMRQSGGGVIINIASDAGKLATPGEALIGAGMAGIIMFSRVLAMEAKRNGIRVNVVTPSIIGDTPTHLRVMADPFASKLFGKAIQAAHLGVGVADDLAALIVFLSSPDAARLTGQAISVNGGISAA
jgi:2-hydroxycyclohexanecarboxyl-CoA dehydrogenase